MQAWQEFVSGEGYSTSLKSSNECVTTSMEQDEGRPFVLVKGSGEGTLFFRVLGATLYALAGHSDDVWPRLMRWESLPK